MIYQYLLVALSTCRYAAAQETSSDSRTRTTSQALTTQPANGSVNAATNTKALFCLELIDQCDPKTATSCAASVCASCTDVGAAPINSCCQTFSQKGKHEGVSCFASVARVESIEKTTSTPSLSDPTSEATSSLMISSTASVAGTGGSKSSGSLVRIRSFATDHILKVSMRLSSCCSAFF